MDPTWPFLLMFESRVERHSFCGIETLNDYMYSQVDELSTDPRVWGVTVIDKFGESQILSFHIRQFY